MAVLQIGEDTYIASFDKDSIILQRDLITLSLLFQDSWILYVEGIQASDSLVKALENIFKIKIEKIVYTA